MLGICFLRFATAFISLTWRKRAVVVERKRLTERQDSEIAIYDRTKAELEKARDVLTREAYLALWEEKNDQLRNLGIKLVPLED